MWGQSDLDAGYCPHLFCRQVITAAKLLTTFALYICTDCHVTPSQGMCIAFFSL